MAALYGSLTGLFVSARRTAQRRKQRMTTAHALLVMLRSDAESSALMTQGGVRETGLLSALKVANEESTSAVEVAAERATRLAAQLACGPPRPLHLLAVLVREPRCAAYRCLEHAGANPPKLMSEVWVALGADDESALSGPQRRLGQQAHPQRMPSRPRASPVARRGLDRPTPRRDELGAKESRRIDGREQHRARTRTPNAVPNSHAASEAPAGKAAAPNAARADLPGGGACEERTAGGDSARSLQGNSALSERRAGGARAEPPDGAGPDLECFELDRRRFPLLTKLGRNLSLLAAAGMVDPVIGRDEELERVQDILARRRANNPLLVGPPGVGKTALVEGLAQRLVEAADVRLVIELSVGALVSGTGVRGALSDRVQKLREEVRKAEGRVLLFLDEIHAIVGPEAGPDDLVTELKAALARGEFPCIGATTDREYRKYIERDAALLRRFSRVEVAEPSAADTLRILGGVAPRYQAHHGVAYEAEALGASVEFSKRYLRSGHLPDKAISVLDLAGARIRRRGGTRVTRAAVADVVSQEAHIPVDRLLMRDSERLIALEAQLSERVVGQAAAMDRVANALRKGAAGFRGRRPLASFLFLGPTGVGKTETARVIQEVLYGGAQMARFDMSEFSEPHATARLLGAPPGYVGHEDGGQLTEAVRSRPYQLVLLDEIEKAHPEVLLSLLPLLDEGHLTDARGRRVDFTHTVVVMTSNLGAISHPSARVGFGATSRVDAPGAGERGAGAKLARERQGANALMAARRALAPELWNRIDEPLFFGPLGREDVCEIARRMLGQVAAVLAREHRVTMRAEPSAVEALIAAGGFDPELGARPMRRTIGRSVEAPLALALLKREVGPGDELVLTGAGKAISFRKAKQPPTISVTVS